MANYLEKLPDWIFDKIARKVDRLDEKIALYQIKPYTAKSFMFNLDMCDTSHAFKQVSEYVERKELKPEFLEELATELIKRNTLGQIIRLKDSAIGKTAIERRDFKTGGMINGDYPHFTPDRYDTGCPEEVYKKKLYLLSNFESHCRMESFFVKKNFVNTLLYVCARSGFLYKTFSGQFGEINKAKLQSYFLEFDNDDFERELLIDEMKWSNRYWFERHSSTGRSLKTKPLFSSICEIKWIRDILDMKRSTLMIVNLLNDEHSSVEPLKAITETYEQYALNKKMRDQYPKNLGRFDKFRKRKQEVIFSIVQIIKLDHKKFEQLSDELDELEKEEKSLKDGNNWNKYQKRHNGNCFCRSIKFSFNYQQVIYNQSTAMSRKEEEIKNNYYRRPISSVEDSEEDEDVIESDEENELDDLADESENEQ